MNHKRHWNRLVGALCAAGVMAGAQTSHALIVTNTINVAAGEIIPANNALPANNWTPDGGVVGLTTNINEYVLNGYVTVISNAVLNIAPGTVVRGVAGVTSADTGTLFVSRGGKLNAVGTPSRPIIFTATDDNLLDPGALGTGASARGKWGGIVLLGRGILNRRDVAVPGGANGDGSVYQVYEGLTTGTVNSDGQPRFHFGGPDNNDSSGVLKYVSIRHQGKKIESDKELNGLSMGGVGRGTVLEHIEVYCGVDDGFEWWGGAVNSRYLSVAYVDDDMFDTDEGHMGRHQFWFGLQNGDGDEGLELNGQPTGGSNVNSPGLQPYGQHQIYNATLLGSTVSDTENGGPMELRGGWAGAVHNSVFTEFTLTTLARTPSGVANGNAVPRAEALVTHNLFYGNAGSPTGTGLGLVNSAAQYTPNTTGSNPNLVNTDRGQNNLLDPRPTAGSPAFSGYKAAPGDGFFCDAPYKGAFDGVDNWLAGWTALAMNEHLAAPFGPGVLGQVFVSGEITPANNGNTNNNWTANYEYVLNGYVTVISNAVLNIAPGTVVRGVAGVTSADTGTLFVSRGGKLNAVGTPSRPIIFTATDDNLLDPGALGTGASARGKWGGIVLLGRGILNRRDVAVPGGANGDGSVYQVYEGLTTGTVNSDGQPRFHFGGPDNNDSSGVLKYVSIRHQGKKIESDKELNGLSMGGVGRGTVLEHIEVYCGVDDGFEWWGGAVNSRYLSVAYVDDDMFDTDEGHMGRHQFWFGLQNGDGDEGLELNGQPTGGSNVNSPGLQPYGQHQIYNATLLGSTVSDTENGGPMELRGGWAGAVHNSVFTEFTLTTLARTPSGVANGNAVPRAEALVTHNLFYGNAGSPTGTGLGLVNSAAQYTPNTTGSNPNLVNTDRGQNNLLDPRPASSASLIYSGWRTPPVNGHFEQTAFRGAFDKEMWLDSWTALAANGHLRSAELLATSTGKRLARVNAQVAVSGDNATLTWSALPLLTYAVQQSTDLVNWTTIQTKSLTSQEAAGLLNSDPITLAGAGVKKHFRVITSN